MSNCAEHQLAVPRQSTISQRRSTKGDSLFFLISRAPMLTVVLVWVCAATKLARNATAVADWKSMLTGCCEERMNRSTGGGCKVFEEDENQLKTLVEEIFVSIPRNWRSEGKVR